MDTIKIGMTLTARFASASAFLAICALANAQEAVSLDQAYHLMYELRFDAARATILSWQSRFPADPVGPASEAANLLFEEFERLGILQAQFYESDSRFLARKKVVPNPKLYAQFDAALKRCEKLAKQQLAVSPKDKDALFSLALVYGLRADYAALIEKRNLASLRLTKQASLYADQLIAIAPDYYDAYLATGLGKYIIGSLFAPVRWLLQASGYDADKQKGIEELKKTAAHGRLLGPFARLLLAVGYLRDNDVAQAKRLLAGLRDEFPSNPLFGQELARLK